MAVSAGLDSTVLAHGLASLGDSLSLTLALGHVNHGLRGEESEADERATRELADRLELPFAVRQIAPQELREDRPSRSRPSLQEAARTLRYRALLKMADQFGARFVATAHHADDQAETVLLRVLRGCGPDSLGGIPEVSHDARVVRPLLGCPRSLLLAAAQSQGFPWREDRSNTDERYARNRLRRQWLPGLAENFNPQLLRTIANLAEAHRRDAEWIATQVDREAARLFNRKSGELWITRGGWGDIPEALARRLAHRALLELDAGREVSRTHLLRIVEFWRDARTGSGIELPAGLRLVCERDRFRLWRDRVEVPGAC